MHFLFMCLCIVPIIVKAAVKQPYGVLMCDTWCSNVIGCSNYFYTSNTLLCAVNGAEISTSSHLTDLHAVRKILNDPMPHCLNSSEVIISRAGLMTCAQHRNITSQHGRGNELEPLHGNRSRKQLPTRLLMSFSASPYGKPLTKQFFLANMSSETVPLEWVGSISALTYVSVTNTLLVASGHAASIFSIDLDNMGKNNKVLKSKIFCTALSADESKRLLFLSSRDNKGNHVVKMMPFDAKFVHIIYPFNVYVSQITVDEKNRVLYIMTKRLKKVSYDGTIIFEYGTRIQSPMTIKVQEEIAFCFKSSYINVQSLKERSSAEVKSGLNPGLRRDTPRLNLIAKVGPKPGAIVQIGDNLYLFDEKMLRVVSISGKKITHKAKHGMTLFQILLCKIP